MHDLAAHLANLMTGYATGNEAPILQNQISTVHQPPPATGRTRIRDGLRRLAAVSGVGAS